MGDSYFIMSKYYSTENPAYALVDDNKYPNQVICYTGPPASGYKRNWNIILKSPLNSGLCYLILADDQDQRRAEQDHRTNNVMVGETEVLWRMSPPLTEGGPDTPRTIATAVSTMLHHNEWTIHGEPEDKGTPDSLVRVESRVFSADVNPKSLWYVQMDPNSFIPLPKVIFESK